MVFRLIIVLFFFSVGAFSQEKFIKHSISKGENLTIIAKKYGIKPQDIEKANPNAPKTLKLNSVLLIPNTNQKSVVKTTEVIATVETETHKILAKETLWGISKKYKISVEDLKKANPFLETEGLKVGQEICIVPNSAPVEDKAAEEVVADTDVVMDRMVLPKETKYAIAREFGITVGELERQNPEIKGKLPVGYTLKIKVPKEKAVALEASKPILEEKTSTVATPVIVQAASETSVKKDTTAAVTYKFQADIADQLISNATENIGIRYRSGGTTKAGFDCSGLMICTFNNFDIKLPRSSIEQSRFGSKINTAEAQKGDLIFFKTNGRRQINHVGMVVEVVEGEIKFVHSSTHGGVMISSTKEPYYQRAFTQVNRVLE